MKDGLNYSLFFHSEKIAFSLLHDFKCINGTVIIPFSKTTWSEDLNVSRTSLSRELKALCEQGIIHMDGNRIVFLQKNLLASLLW